jgi:hypothetical protein
MPRNLDPVPAKRGAAVAGLVPNFRYRPPPRDLQTRREPEERLLGAVADVLLDHAARLGLSEALGQGGGSRFVVGYLAGVAHALCPGQGAGGRGARRRATALLYERVFGPGRGGEALVEVLRRCRTDREAVRAFRQARYDSRAVMDEELRTFAGLFRHLRGEADAAAGPHIDHAATPRHEMLARDRGTAVDPGRGK